MKHSRRHFEFAGCPENRDGGGVNSEARVPKSEASPKLEARISTDHGEQPRATSGAFDFRISGLLRTSDLGLRTSALRAFTLLELLLAVVVFSIVLLSMHYVFYGAIKLRNKTTQAVENALPQQQALMMIRRDLANIVPPNGTSVFFGQFSTPVSSGLQSATALAGRQVGPTFYTASGMVEESRPWSEMRKVSYQLSSPTNLSTGLDLYRNVTRNLASVLTEQVEAQWLLGGVEDMTFLYYDGTQWRDTWNGTNETVALPTAVKLQIQLVARPEERQLPQPIEMIVPVYVQPSTNSTTETTGGGA
jgi:type II secretion system protein J